jgi:hypothetical protein
VGYGYVGIIREMTENLNTEITKLFALHKATLELEHGVKRVALCENNWRVFTPTRFIYAFFTFNRIYGFDWQSSIIDKHKAIRWSRNENGKYPKEVIQIKDYLTYVNTQLLPETPLFFAKELRRILDLFGIYDPVTTLKNADLVNASKETEKICRHLDFVLQGTQDPEIFFQSAYYLLRFVYRVRCNVFHGSKTVVHMLNTEQQKRLSIYSALLIAANSLLFLVAKKSNIGWNEVSVDFDQSNGT